VDLAEEMGCAVYGVTHFTKGTAGKEPVERVTSSLAFGALTRMVTVAMKLPDKGEHPKGSRLFVRAKSNIGPDGGGFYYFIDVGPIPGHPEIINTRILWGDPVNGTAKEMLARAEAPGDDDGVLDDAIEWLKEVLSDGPMPASDIIKAAKCVGISRSTLHRAKSRLRIRSTKVGFSKGWGWSLPEVDHEDSTKGPIQPDVKSSEQKHTQPIDIFEDSTKVLNGQKMRCMSTFADHEDSTEGTQGVKSSDGPTVDGALGGVDPTKISSSRMLGSSGYDEFFDENDEVIL
jgi:putative DNA primase/helicase